MGLAGLSFLVYRYSKAVFFGIWWFLITLFPVSNLIEIYNPFAERYLYIPIIGFCLVVPVVIDGSLVRRWFTRPAIATLVTLIPTLVILGLYSAATHRTQPRLAEQFCVVVENRSKLTQQSRCARRTGYGVSRSGVS